MHSAAAAGTSQGHETELKDKTCWSRLRPWHCCRRCRWRWRAAGGVGGDVRLRRPSLCLRACIADGGLAPLGGVHLIGVVLEHGRVNGVGSIGRGPPDLLGLNLPDRV